MFTANLRVGASRLAVVAALGLTLTACGDDADKPKPASATQTASNGDVFNDADVQFASNMIQHHAQALVMVDMTRGRTLEPAVRELTEQIREAQAPEIETMTDWLTAWDKEVPTTMRDHSNAGHDMDMEGDMSDRMHGTGSDMPGMMTAEEMDELNEASDAEFQDLWLEMMIEHHQGAIEMARVEQSEGTFDGAIDLAEHIETSQEEEITTMEGLLD